MNPAQYQPNLVDLAQGRPNLKAEDLIKAPSKEPSLF
jgi:hypothetical protein